MHILKCKSFCVENFNRQFGRRSFGYGGLKDEIQREIQRGIKIHLNIFVFTQKHFRTKIFCSPLSAVFISISLSAEQGHVLGRAPVALFVFETLFF